MLGAAAHEPENREEFCRRYEPIVRTYLSVRWQLPRDHERISDAAQEVFLRCFRPGGPLQKVDPKRGRFRSYLQAITGNVALEQERARRRDQRRVEGWQLDNIETSEETLSRVFDKAWAEMITAEAWGLVAQRKPSNRPGGLQRDVLILRFVEGLPPREIATKLGFADVKDVYRIVETGRQQFRTALLTVLAGYHPDLSAAELEQKCIELLESL